MITITAEVYDPVLRANEKRSTVQGGEERRREATGVCRKSLPSPIIIYEADYGSPTMPTLKRLSDVTVPADVDDSSFGVQCLAEKGGNRIGGGR